VIRRQRQPHDRTHGPALGAADDGLSQGSAYKAVALAASSGGWVKVTIPAISISQPYMAKIKTGTIAPGATVLVLFDEERVPWVVSF